METLVMIPEAQLKDISAAAILAMNSPADLFVFNSDETKSRWNHLRSLWHPDRHDDKDLANQVFIKVKTLYETALKHISAGLWGSGTIAVFAGKTSDYSMMYLRQNDIEGFGTQYVGRNEILYDVPDSNEDLIKVWVENHKALRVTEPALNKEFHDQFQAVPLVVEYLNGLLVNIKKPPEYLNLAHVLANGPLDPKHVAWIMSRLLSLGCLMEYRNIPNLAITPQSIFIDPAQHSVILLHGWQYAKKFYEKAVAAPRKVLRQCPDLAVTEEPKPIDMLIQIKAVGRECLGDPIGVNLHKLAHVPKPLTTWLNIRPNKTCKSEFNAWEGVKKASFGLPRFIELNLTEKDVYK
jgi:hypothetical protein